MTKVEVIIQIMKENNGIANWKILYNNFAKYYPSIKKSETWQAGIRGVLLRELYKNKYFKKIDNSTYSLIDYNENNLLLDNFIGDENTKTNRKSIVETRIKQDKLRDESIKRLKLCPFTQITDKRLLIISHIKPWAFSDNKERLDLNNIFVFSPLYDKLFDRGLISFKNDKTLMIAKDLSKNNREKIGVQDGILVDLLPIIGREEYLEYHRKNVFLD